MQEPKPTTDARLVEYLAERLRILRDALAETTMQLGLYSQQHDDATRAIIARNRNLIANP